jgi:drug/metabolite transporter (DMT)-like permease
VSTHPSDARRGILAMCLSMATFLVNDTLVKLVSERVPMDQIVLLRGVLASLGVLAWLALAAPRTLGLVRHPGMARVGWRAALDALSTFTFLWALFNMPLPNISAINLSGPLMVTVLAVLFLGERVHWRRWSAIAAGLVGVVMIIQPSGAAFDWFSLVALAPKKVAALAGLSVAVRGWTPMEARDLALLAVAALFLVGGYHFIVVAMRAAETSVVAPFRYTSILWALLLGYVVWGDVPNPLAVAGIVVLVASGLYLMHRERLARLAARSARRGESR